ncbi:MAG: IS3 family transposase, partial [Bacteroidota bacterium]
MRKKRKVYSSNFKGRVALEALQERQTLSEIANKHSLHPNQISKWKQQVKDGIGEVFDNKRGRKSKEEEELINRLYQQIGQLQVELDWLKKKLPSSLNEKRMFIEKDHEHLSITRQCSLLGLNRSTYYYEAIGESEENLRLMRLIEEHHLKYPYYGSPRMSLLLSKLEGRPINDKRVARLMRLMRIRSVLPKPNLSKPAQGHQIYPYLLRNLSIEKSNQVWSTDITYIPMKRGFLYLCAVMDWYSRYVLSWELSNNMERWFCIEVLEKALERGNPEIFNTDQGSQFTSDDFTNVLKDRGIRISMDGKGRALDNIFTERLWWSVKYEDVYLKAYDNGADLWKGLDQYFQFYNQERPHQ